MGPGSFTGIRVGLAAARGIALAPGARLIGVTSFEAVAAGPPGQRSSIPAFLLVALESRREDLFIQLFDRRRNPVGEPAAVMPAALREVVNAAIGAAPLLIAGDAAHRAAILPSSRVAHTLMFSRIRRRSRSVSLRAALRRLRLAASGASGAAALSSRRPTCNPVAAGARDRGRRDRAGVRHRGRPDRDAPPRLLSRRSVGCRRPLHKSCASRDFSASVAWQEETPVGFALALNLGDEVRNPIARRLARSPAERDRFGAARCRVRSRRAPAAPRAVVLEVAVDNVAARVLSTPPRLYCRRTSPELLSPKRVVSIDALILRAHWQQPRAGLELVPAEGASSRLLDDLTDLLAAAGD